MNSPIDNRFIENVYILSVCALALLIPGGTDSFACAYIHANIFYIFYLVLLSTGVHFRIKTVELF